MTIFSVLLFMLIVNFVSLYIFYRFFKREQKSLQLEISQLKETLKRNMKEEFSKNKELLDKDVKEIFTKISNILEINSKIVKTLNRLTQKVESKFQTVETDVNNLYNWSKAQNQVIVQQAKDFQNLIKRVYLDIRDLHCDLNENSCDICSFHKHCTKDIPVSEKDDESSLNISPFSEKPSDSDFEELECIEIKPQESDWDVYLTNTLRNIHIPEEVINKYLSYLKNLVSVNKDIQKILVKTGILKTNNMNCIYGESFEGDSDKTISNNSKIIKTLDKLFHKE